MNSHPLGTVTRVTEAGEAARGDSTDHDAVVIRAFLRSWTMRGGSRTGTAKPAIALKAKRRRSSGPRGCSWSWRTSLRSPVGMFEEGGP